MQEQVPFSMPMEYHLGLFFSFFYARTGAHRGALLYEYHHGLFFSFFYARTGALRVSKSGSVRFLPKKLTKIKF